MENFLKSSMPDIAANVRSIEKGKNSMLSCVSEIFNLMAWDYNENTQEAIEAKLAELIIESFLLGQKLGTDTQSLNDIICNSLRMRIINEDSQKELCKSLFDALKNK